VVPALTPGSDTIAPVGKGSQSSRANQSEKARLGANQTRCEGRSSRGKSAKLQNIAKIGETRSLQRRHDDRAIPSSPVKKDPSLGRAVSSATKLRVSLGFLDHCGEFLAECSRELFGDFQRRSAFPALDETYVRVMNAGGFGKRLLGQAPT